MTRRVLIVGGYGAFGARVAERLARDETFSLTIAGRSAGLAAAAADALAHRCGRKVEYAAVDATRPAIAALAPSIVINASGPFQAQDYALAEAAIGCGSHYVDLADARAFVANIGRLNGRAKAAGVAVISGASSVPGLSSAVVAHLAPQFQQMDEIELGISPGNSFDPGLATTQSIMGWVGKPLAAPGGTVYGWQGLKAHAFPTIGRRLMGHCDIPDFVLLARAYPQLAAVRTMAGVEVKAFHLAVWALSGLVRAGLVADLTPLARPLLAVKRCLPSLGSDEGGMYVTASGTGHTGARLIRTWHLEAKRGHGPYIPAIASVVLARKLAAGGVAAGARACFGAFTLDDFMHEVSDLAITTSEA